MATARHTEEVLPYRLQKSLEVRLQESSSLLQSDSTRVPIIIERAANEKFLPLMPRIKFLIPRSSPLSNLHSTIRVRMQLHQDQSFFLLVNGRHIPMLASLVQEVYNDHKAGDGFLYMTYASQEVFG